MGTLAHPLNQARFDPAQGALSRATRSCSRALAFTCRPRIARASRAFGLARRASIPTRRPSSDIYQDLFGAGSFTGKGIYDVDAFEAATGHTFPDNHILSHDLIEGNSPAAVW